MTDWPCRIAVIGATGSGKTCLAKALALRLGVPHVELDALYWAAGWQPVQPEVFRARVAKALTGAGWVTDGNYRRVRDLVWGQATALVWLDYPLPVVLWRLARRTFGRVLAGTELYNGNRESLRMTLLSRDSIFLWALRSRPSQRREYPALLASPEYTHLSVFHLRSPHEADRWLSTLK